MPPHNLVPTGMDVVGPILAATTALGDPSELSTASETSEVVLEGVRLPADEQLAFGVATLMVQTDGEKHFTLLARSPGIFPAPDPPPEKRELPNVSLADIARPGGSTPNVVVHRMFIWSRSVGIAGWLLELARRGARLEIEDSSGFEIPWEMLTLSPGLEDETYLGLAMAVSRRLTTVPLGPDACAVSLE